MIYQLLNKKLTFAALVIIALSCNNGSALTPEEVLASGIAQLQAQHKEVTEQLQKNDLDATTKTTLQQKKSELELSLAALTTTQPSAVQVPDQTNTDTSSSADNEDKRRLNEIGKSLKEVESFFYDASLSIEDRIAVTERISLSKEFLKLCHGVKPTEKNNNTINKIIHCYELLFADFKDASFLLELLFMPVPLSSEQGKNGFLSINTYNAACVKLFNAFHHGIVEEPIVAYTNPSNYCFNDILATCCPVPMTTKSLKKIMSGSAAAYLSKMPHDELRSGGSCFVADSLKKDYLSLMTTYYRKNPVELLMQQKKYGQLLEQTINDCFELFHEQQIDGTYFILQRMLDKLMAIKADLNRISITSIEELVANNAKKEVFVRYQVLVHSHAYQLFAHAYPELDQLFIGVLESFFKEKEQTASLATWYSLNRTKTELTNQKIALQGGLCYRFFYKRQPLLEPIDETIIILGMIMESIKENAGAGKSSLLTGLATAAASLAPVVAGKLDTLLRAYLGGDTTNNLSLPSQQHLAAILQMYPKVLDELCSAYPEFSKLRSLISPQTYTPLFGKV